MSVFPFKKIISVLVIELFLWSLFVPLLPSEAFAGHSDTSNRKSIFSNKQVNVDAIRQQKQDFFDKKKQL
ncbi:MAG: hypothetical protein JW844_08740, partial [Candidatus Omnitrophica bacterium]|nr:hypothetical protein [Candidatus Omnitrophota bacterium]